MDNFLIVTGLAVLVILLIIGSWALSAFLLMWGWNIFVPAVFGLTTITFMQSLGLAFIAWVIGGFFRSFTAKK